jgi:hypothetical protein
LRGHDLRQLLLRDVEQNRNRPDLRQRHDSGPAAGAHEIADIDIADAGTPVDRRSDDRVAQRLGRAVDLGLVDPDLCHHLLDGCLLRLDLLAARCIGLQQRRIAREIALLVGELRLVLRLLGDGLIVGGLIEGRIDAGEDVALSHVLAFLKADLGDLAIDLRVDRHRVERTDRADRLDIDGHVGDFGGRSQNGNRRAPAASARSAAAELRRLRRACRQHDRRQEDGEAGEPRYHQNPS